MDEQELKELFKNTFNTVAGGYDNAAMSFFPESAKHLPSHLNLQGNEHVLDVATGTGIAAFAIAQALPNGHVTGIDFSKGMLSQAIEKKTVFGIKNVTFTEMDMQVIEFPNEHFDIAVSAFSIFFVEDMKRQLIHIANKIKNGGKVITTTFFDNSFSPIVEIFLDHLNKYGIEPPTFAWKRVASKEQCIALFEEAGLHSTTCEQIECGYFLNNAEDWLHIVWNGGFRGLVNQLSPNDLAKFKEEHLVEVEKLASDKGIWLEMSILYTIGIK